MKSTIKLRKILEQYDCTFRLDSDQNFEIYVADLNGDLKAEFCGKSFSVAIGLVYTWVQKQQKKNSKVKPDL